MFKRVATLEFKKILASDNGKYYWRDLVKSANQVLTTDNKFLPADIYKLNTQKFIYLQARSISGGEKWGCNGNADYFPWEEIKKAIPTFIGKGFYLEHQEDSEKDAKGIILDAEPNDEEQYALCLVAIDREEYPDFVQKVLSGEYNQVSMSCLAATAECLSPGTHIYTPDGQVKIQDIKVGDYVLTHKGRFQKVLKTFVNPMPEYTYKIYFESGREKQIVNDTKRYNGTWIRATGNHPIYMSDGTWKNAEDIKVGDLVKCLTKKCPVCGKDIVYSKKQKYCSASCQSKDTQNRKDIIKRRVASFKNTIANRTIEEKKRLHEILSKGYEKWKNSSGYVEAIKKGTEKTKKFLKEFYASNASLSERQRRSKFQKDRWKDNKYRKHITKILRDNTKKNACKKRSYLEEKFEGFLMKEGLIKGIDYKTNDFLCINKLRAYPDFKFEKQKLIVEIDGDYWHNNPEVIKRDSYKNKIWQENGWTVIRYTGKQVNNEFEKVKDSFKRIFKNHNHEYTFGDFKVIKIEKMKTTPKCHNVYNLHVEEDESYIAENLVVHNCSECGNVATSMAELCPHMNPNNPMTYLKGQAGPDGKVIYEINKDLCFTGLSAVRVPADKDAFVFDIKASKKKEDLKNELVKYQKVKQAGKMKEYLMACQENIKELDNVSLLNKLRATVDSLSNSLAFTLENCTIDPLSSISTCVDTDEEAKRNMLNAKVTSTLQEVLKELVFLQSGLNAFEVGELEKSIEKQNEIMEKPIIEEVTNVENNPANLSQDAVLEENNINTLKESAPINKDQINDSGMVLDDVLLEELNRYQNSNSNLLEKQIGAALNDYKKTASKKIRVNVFDIDWDLDEESTEEYMADELPDYYDSLLIDVEDVNDDDEIYDAISNKLYEEYGWTVENFNYFIPSIKKSSKKIQAGSYFLKNNKELQEFLDTHGDEIRDFKVRKQGDGYRVFFENQHGRFHDDIFVQRDPVKSNNEDEKILKEIEEIYK